jgi:hypothetical protein
MCYFEVKCSLTTLLTDSGVLMIVSHIKLSQRRQYKKPSSINSRKSMTLEDSGKSSSIDF